METLTSRKRLKRCYSYKEVDRPGVYSRTGFPSNDPSYNKLKSYLRQYSDLKKGWHPDIVKHSYNIKTYTEPYSEDFERKITVYNTNMGEFKSSRLVGLKGQPGLEETYLLKTEEDIKRYLSLPMPEIKGDISSYFKLDQKIGDRGIVQIGLGRNPGGYAKDLMGSETLAIMSITNRELVKRICQRRKKILIKILKYLFSKGVGSIFGMAGHEHIAPPLHGKKDFYDFNVQYDKPIIDLIHNNGGRVHIHCHGKLKKVFQGFIDMGVDVLHPIEPPPLGDLSAAEAKNKAREKICIEGNIQIHKMYENTPEEIREETLKLIHDVFDDRKGLIVSPSASPYIYGEGKQCFPQYKAMVDTVINWSP